MSDTGELLQYSGTERRPQREAPSPLQLYLKVDWCRARLAVRHDYMFEDVKRVGALMEKQTSRTTLDDDVEEVVKWPEVLHSEFPLKSRNGTAQELRAGCGQDDIINIK
jgi:hypothetical protein